MARDGIGELALGGEPTHPGLLRPLTGDDYLGIVTPMRIF